MFKMVAGKLHNATILTCRMIVSYGLNVYFTILYKHCCMRSFVGTEFVIFTLLASLNSCANPWIYLTFSWNCCTKKPAKDNGLQLRSCR